MSSKKVAEIVVETLEAAGVRHCYGIVGDTLNHVTDAIHRSQIQWVHVRHEEAAAFAAGAESYISGRLTACAGSCGPGSLHFINGVYEAQRNRAPMVLIASQIVTPQLGMEFPQEVDFKAVYASCSVFCEQVHSPEQARRVVALACQAALNRRGVAVVILPADISQATVKDDLPFSVHFRNRCCAPATPNCRTSPACWPTARRSASTPAPAARAPTTCWWPSPTASRRPSRTRRGPRTSSSTTTPSTWA